MRNLTPTTITQAFAEYGYSLGYHSSPCSGLNSTRSRVPSRTLI